MHEKRPTLADVAARCGVTAMTASRALRANTQVSPKTRAAVQAAAKELGYRADPFLSTLVTYRANVRRRQHRASLAYVTNYPPSLEWRSWGSFGGYWKGAQARAIELGYEIEEFSRHGIPTVRRAEEILHHRGYTGLLLGPSLSPSGHTRLKIGELPAVALGQSLRAPRLHYATANVSRAVMDLLHHVKKLGYRRPGFATQRSHDARNEHHASSAFLGWQAQFIAADARVPPCVVPAEEYPTALRAWLKRWRPDVIISTERWAAQLLEEKGLRFPDDLGYVCSNLSDDEPDLRFAGMVSDYRGVGAAAIDLLHAQILRGEKGVPARPRGVLVDAVWRPGGTVKTSAASGARDR